MNSFTQTELARLSGLIDSIYASINASASDQWCQVMQNIAGFVGASRCALFTPHYASDNGGVYCCHGTSPEYIEGWQTHYRTENPWHIAATQSDLYQEGKVLNSDAHVPHQELFKTAFYQTFLAPQGIAHSLTGVVYGMNCPSGKPSVILTLYRGAKQGTFTCDEQERLGLLLPHLKRALLAKCQLHNLESKVTANLVAMDRLNMGVLLINDLQHVIYANQLSRKILDEQDGIQLTTAHGQLSEECLTVADTCTAHDMQIAMGKAIAHSTLSNKPYLRTLSLPRPSGKAAYLLHFRSLTGCQDSASNAMLARAIILITGGEQRYNFDLIALKRIYALSTAEVKVIQSMVENTSLDASAQQLNLSNNTLKSHLKSIYKKTDVSSRTQLMKVIFTSFSQME